MLDIAWSELMVIAVVALVFIGPKDLPKAIYTLGKWVRKARLIARDFQGHLDDMVREAELDDLRQQALKTRDLNLQKMVEGTVDPKGELRNAFDVGLTGHPGSPSETSSPAPAAAPADAQTVAAQPLPATEPPVTVPQPPAPPVEFVPAPAAGEPAAPHPAPVAAPQPAHINDKQA